MEKAERDIMKFTYICIYMSVCVCFNVIGFSCRIIY